MIGLLEDILQIPNKAKECYQNSKGISLPTNVPYLGMGSSYYAALTVFYAGAKINPQIASEYYYYLSPAKQKLGVLISQSGESSETVWNLEKFDKVVSITNDPNSTLAKADNVKKVIEIFAGSELFTTTKTYINTLVALYCGLGIEPIKAINVLTRKFEAYKNTGEYIAGLINEYILSHKIKGLYVIGSGSNYGTANQSALTLSETTKRSWIGLSVAQYDHGAKETAKDSVVIVLNSHGKDAKRIEIVKQTLKENSNALVVEALETNLSEQLSPFTLITQLNFVMNYLADYLKVGSAFIGGKITKVDTNIK